MGIPSLVVVGSPGFVSWTSVVAVVTSSTAEQHSWNFLCRDGEGRMGATGNLRERVGFGVKLKRPKRDEEEVVEVEVEEEDFGEEEKRVSNAAADASSAAIFV